MAKSGKNGRVTQRQAVRMFFELGSGKSVSNEELDKLGRGAIRRLAPNCAEALGLQLQKR